MISIRRIELEDIELFYEINRDEKTAYYQGMNPLKSIEEAKVFFNDQSYIKNTYVIEKDNCGIGTYSITYLKDNAVMIAFALKNTYQNLGIMTSFLKDLISHIFVNTNTVKIYAGAMEENQPSIKLISKHFIYDSEKLIFYNDEIGKKNTIFYQVEKQNFIYLENEDYFLRPIYLSDKEDIFKFASNKSVANSAGFTPHSSINETEDVINKQLTKAGNYGIVSKDDFSLIGSYHVILKDETFFVKNDILRGKIIEIGFILSSDYHNRSIITNITKELLAKIRTEKIDFIVLRHFDDNIASKKIAEKFDFKFLTSYQHELHKELKTTLLYYLKLGD